MARPVGPVLRSLGVEPDDFARVAGLSDLEGVTIAAAPRFMRCLWVGSVAAMAVGRRIFVDPTRLAGDRRTLARLILHELVHVRQWRASGAIGFVGRYLADYLGSRLHRRSHLESYARIPFEIEARIVGASFEID